MSWQRQNKGGIYASNMDYRFCSLHLQSTSEILEILRRAPNTLHIQVERWDQRVIERSLGYVVFVLLILRRRKIYVEKLFYCGVDKTPPLGSRGRAHSLAGEGVGGGFQFQRGDKHCGTLGIYVLADRKYHVCNDHSIRRLGWNYTVHICESSANGLCEYNVGG